MHIYVPYNRTDQVEQECRNCTGIEFVQSISSMMQQCNNRKYDLTNIIIEYCIKHTQNWNILNLLILYFIQFFDKTNNYTNLTELIHFIFARAVNLLGCHASLIGQIRCQLMLSCQ